MTKNILLRVYITRSGCVSKWNFLILILFIKLPVCIIHHIWQTPSVTSQEKPHF